MRASPGATFAARARFPSPVASSTATSPRPRATSRATPLCTSPLLRPCANDCCVSTNSCAPIFPASPLSCARSVASSARFVSLPESRTFIPVPSSAAPTDRSNTAPPCCSCTAPPCCFCTAPPCCFCTAAPTAPVSLACAAAASTCAWCETTAALWLSSSFTLPASSAASSASSPMRDLVFPSAASSSVAPELSPTVNARPAAAAFVAFPAGCATALTALTAAFAVECAKLLSCFAQSLERIWCSAPESSACSSASMPCTEPFPTLVATFSPVPLVVSPTLYITPARLCTIPTLSTAASHSGRCVALLEWPSTASAADARSLSVSPSSVRWMDAAFPLSCASKWCSSCTRDIFVSSSSEEDVAGVYTSEEWSHSVFCRSAEVTEPCTAACSRRWSMRDAFWSSCRFIAALKPFGCAADGLATTAGAAFTSFATCDCFTFLATRILRESTAALAAALTCPATTCTSSPAASANAFLKAGVAMLALPR
ncbi:hypothetical protein T484DRAFT_1980758 [Baffinella frigidus]|nr:hypothetical protein T484DRAFT_1980758 [Cryptophyta sp. CCMP2293]